MENKTGLEKLLDSLVYQSLACGQGTERYILSGIIDYTKKLIEEESKPITKEDVQFMTECNMHPHYYNGKICAVKILTEDSEGSLIDPKELLKLSDILIRYVNKGIEKYE